MKINDTPLSNTAAPALGGTGAADNRRGARGAGANSAARDSVQLSELSSRLARLLHSDSSERADRMQRLTALVRSGQYQPDPAAIGRAIVDDGLVAEP